VKAVVQDLRSLKGKGIVNVRDRKIYRITAVGIAGVTCYQVNEDGKMHGPEICITWRAFKVLYSIIVPVEDIDDGKLVKV